jgi:hypothetical protein
MKTTLMLTGVRRPVTTTTTTTTTTTMKTEVRVGQGLSQTVRERGST